MIMVLCVCLVQVFACGCCLLCLSVWLTFPMCEDLSLYLYVSNGSDDVHSFCVSNQFQPLLVDARTCKSIVGAPIPLATAWH